MKKSTLIIGVIVIAFSASTAHAQSFTYTAKNSASSQIGDIGTQSKGEVKFTYASGKKETGTYECVSMKSPKNSKMFYFHLSCQTKVNDGSFSLIYGCDDLKAKGADVSCIGEMKGKTGAYKNKQGNLSQYEKNGEIIGSGQWFE